MKTPPSSTSRSERSAAWRHVLLPFVCALAALPLGALQLRYVNPQNLTRQRQVAIKLAALQRTAGHPRLLICGDSSVAFGMNPETLQAVTGLPTINLGYTAASGAVALLGVAEEAVQPGDTLVISIIPGLMTGAVESLPEGRLIAMLYHHPEIAVGGHLPLVPYGPTEHLRIWLSACSPGQRIITNDIGRKLMGMKGFRYSDCPVDDWGYTEDTINRPHDYQAYPSTKLSAEWRRALTRYVANLRARGVRVFYAMPWIEVPDGSEAQGARNAQDTLDDINQVVEVLWTDRPSLYADHALFADTGVHLTVAAAVARSRRLGQALNAVSAHQVRPPQDGVSAAQVPGLRVPDPTALADPGLAGVAPAARRL